MKILGLDASGPVCSVALMEDGAVLASAMQNAGLTHSQTLMPMVEAVLAAADCAPCQLDLIGCVAGPGSFTGVRIGVCTAKALAHAHNVPCAQLNALEVLAAGAFGFEGTICPILDARRGQVYCAAFEQKAGQAPRRIMEDGAMPLESFMELLPTEGLLMFVGDGVKLHGGAIGQRFPRRGLIAPAHRSQISAEVACALAQHGGSAADYNTLVPIYLRQSQAERERLAKEGGSVADA